MASGKTSGTSKKNHYNTYKATNSFAKNRERNIKRHLKANPSDEQAKTALTKPAVYSRKPAKGGRLKSTFINGKPMKLSPDGREYRRMLAKLERVLTHEAANGSKNKIKAPLDPAIVQLLQRLDNEQKIEKNTGVK